MEEIKDSYVGFHLGMFPADVCIPQILVSWSYVHFPLQSGLTSSIHFSLLLERSTTSTTKIQHTPPHSPVSFRKQLPMKRSCLEQVTRFVCKTHHSNTTVLASFSFTSTAETFAGFHLGHFLHAKYKVHKVLSDRGAAAPVPMPPSLHSTAAAENKTAA